MRTPNQPGQTEYHSHRGKYQNLTLSRTLQESYLSLVEETIIPLINGLMNSKTYPYLLMNWNEVEKLIYGKRLLKDDGLLSELSSQLHDVDTRANGWSQWSEWSSCSRSCDGGVSHQLRRCQKGTCKGEHIHYKICNMQPCPDSNDFRDDQCAVFNSQLYEGSVYNWYAYYDDQNPCMLTCKGKSITSDEEMLDEPVLVMVKLADKVHDGTRCRPGSLDMCIDGKCKTVGCDLRIDSDLQVDVCGVCGGDGSSCARPLYHWSLTSLSLCSATCGGGYKMSRPICLNRVTGEEVEEQLCNESQKPESAIVECNTHNCPPKWHTNEWGPCSATCGGGSRIRQVHCIEETNSTKIKVNEAKCTGHKPRFQEVCNQIDCPKWHTSQWSGCSVSCGEGVQVRVVECRDFKDELSNLCSANTKPTQTKPCSTGIQCPFTLDEHSEELMPGLYHTQPLIQPYPPPPPAIAERLIGEQVVPSESTFVPDEWGPCSVTCGEGIRKRQVHCRIFLEFSRTIAKLPDNKCSGPKPSETEGCFMEHCSSERIDIKDDPYRQENNSKLGSTTYSWVKQGYTQCSATCLGGVQELIVNCVRDDTKKVTSAYLCPPDQKPEIMVLPCNDIPCPPRWNFSNFTPCSQSCGIGIRTREVNCVHEVAQGGASTVVVPNSECLQPQPQDRQYCNVLDSECLQPQPQDRQYCNVLDCPVGWSISEWSKCSKPCGTGEKTRKAECIQVMAQNHSLAKPIAMCSKPKPSEKKPCNTKSCVLESDKPHIEVSNSTYIQHNVKKKKIFLNVGGAASVFFGTVVKIKCPVKRYNRTKIQWTKDHAPLPKTKKFRVSKKGALRIQNVAYIDKGVYVSKKGALRIQNVAYIDKGVYTCIAGKSTADFILSVQPKPGEFMNSEEIMRQSGFKNERTGGYQIQPRREDKNPVLSNDDHSHEQRPDLLKNPRTSPKTRLFAPTSPSLRMDPNSLNGWAPEGSLDPDHEQDKLFASQAPSSSDSVKPHVFVVENSASSGSRAMPHFQRLISNLQVFGIFFAASVLAPFVAL
ncbi:ADAMTS cysteine-rich domain [Popillia japonica]|uniref:ADAMTS cysteine-rich domain n=1 Tax=Popillia japonica TaxID=7064 RepID=A0AAW1L4W1_POPJA